LISGSVAEGTWPRTALMLLAQLHRKVPADFEGMEDVLTSTVFGLFKYLPNDTASAFLAEFAAVPSLQGPLQVELWPRYPTPPGFRTPRVVAQEDEEPASRGDSEPDVVITTDEWVLVVEAKYHSPLDEEFDQLGREFAVGHRLARDTGRRFRLLVVTGHTLEPRPGGVELVMGLRGALNAASGGLGEAAADVIAAVPRSLHWTNWQGLYRILARASQGGGMQANVRLLLEDVCELLALRGLRPYDGRSIVAALTRWERAQLADEVWLSSVAYRYRTAPSIAGGWERLLDSDMSALGPAAWHPLVSRSDYELAAHLGHPDLETLRSPEWRPSYQMWRLV
jgi:hypothetical protein